MAVRRALDVCFLCHRSASRSSRSGVSFVSFIPRTCPTFYFFLRFFALPRPARGAVTHHHGPYESSALQKKYLRPRCRLSAANWRANGGGERGNDVSPASSESGLQREPSAHTVAYYARSPTYLLARGPLSRSAGGNGLEGPRAIALFDVHTLFLDLTG